MNNSGNNLSRTIGVMQPYFFPYIGYFQLIRAVDSFVFYDDVNYIRQGWINRNSYLSQGKPQLFTIPIESASSFIPINLTFPDSKKFLLWKKKFLQSIKQSYSKSANLNLVMDIIGKSLPEGQPISVLAENSVRNVCAYLGLSKNWYRSSNDFPKIEELERAKRLYEICHKTKSVVYINSIGGAELYTKTEFKKNDLELLFLKPACPHYSQLGQSEFIANLSILDLLFNCSREEILNYLDAYELI